MEGAWGGRGRPVTFQHAEVHGVVGSLGHAEHHLQAVFNLPLPLLAAREQLLQGTETVNWQRLRNTLSARSLQKRVYENPRFAG